MEFHGGDKIRQVIPLNIIIESPMALKMLTDICECGTVGLNNLKLEVVTFGSDDYLACIGEYERIT